IAPGGAQIRGLVAQAGTSSGIGAVNVTVYDDQNRFVVFGFTNADGTYSTEGGLVPGTYYARTSNAPGYEDQAYNGVPCAPCDATSVGTAIVLTEGEIRADIDFVLHAARPALENGLVGWWRFDDRRPVATDSSTSAHDGIFADG